MQKNMLITTSTLGKGDDELGQKLMRAFLTALCQTDVVPRTLVLMNDGVKLACKDSLALEQLKILADRGVEIRACKTCLSYYNLLDSLEVGEPGNMPDTVGMLMSDPQTVVIS